MLSDDKLSSLLSGLENAFAGMVLGKPVVVQETTLLPVLSISAAYGGTNSLQGAGGGGFRMDPVAMVAVNKDNIRVFSLRPGSGLSLLESIDAQLYEVSSPEQTDL
ncbi:GerW family sporulation protein [Sporotomaculum syntrophicum]|nr:GerW family sporulation protein [Sporotomaculum syntrophicum]